MDIVKTQRKSALRPRRAAAKKKQAPKGNIDAINKALKIVDKYNIDFSFLER